MQPPASIRRPDDLGAFIKARREALGWDQTMLAARLGVNRRWVWSVESGKPKVQLDLVLRCLNELQTQLWASTNDSQPSPLSGAVSRQRPLIDINAIADMGLAPQTKAPVRK